MLAAAAIRTIFAQPDAEHFQSQLDVIAGMLGRQSPAVEATRRDNAQDLLASTGFPGAQWSNVRSTDPLERLNKEIKRRTEVVGVFPSPAALLRLAGTGPVEAHAEGQVTGRRHPSEGSMALLPTPPAPADEEVWHSPHSSRHSPIRRTSPRPRTTPQRDSPREPRPATATQRPAGSS